MPVRNLKPLKRNRKPLLSAKRARELLIYNKRTGVLRWRVRVSNVVAGAMAGCRHSGGYRRVRIDGRSYQAHRVIWLIVEGEWPASQIDHEDHIRDNNRWSNLSEATHLENGRNQKLNDNNASGVAGVHWAKKDSRWRAYISIKGKRIHLGSFTSKKAAIAARRKAEKKYGFHKNHGKS